MTKTKTHKSTPGAAWRQAKEPDPHGSRYDCERAELTLGMLTDDELANAAYINYDRRPSPEELIAGTAFSPIVYMTAVKDRIRWLSRSLEREMDGATPAAQTKTDICGQTENAGPQAAAHPPEGFSSWQEALDSEKAKRVSLERKLLGQKLIGHVGAPVKTASITDAGTRGKAKKYGVALYFSTAAEAERFKRAVSPHSIE